MTSLYSAYTLYLFWIPAWLYSAKPLALTNSNKTYSEHTQGSPTSDLWVQGQPHLQNDFQNSNVEKLHLEKPTNETKNQRELFVGVGGKEQVEDGQGAWEQECRMYGIA